MPQATPEPNNQAPEVSQPPVAQSPTKPSAGLAIASMCVSLVGFLTGIFYIGIPLALVGLILGIIALATRGGGKSMAITGICVGGFCLLISPLTVVFSNSFWEGFQEGISGQGQQTQYQYMPDEHSLYN